MSALISIAALGAYLVGWLLTAVHGSRWIATLPYCHMEPRSGSAYQWRTKGTCRKYDKPECWRGDALPNAEAVAKGAALAFVWPLFLSALGVYSLARRKPLPTAGLQQRIDELERELSIGGDS